VKTRFLLFCPAALLVLNFACTSDKKVNNDAVREEIKSREIVRVTDAEILEKVHEIGNSIAQITQTTLGKNLKKAMLEGGAPFAIDFCNVNAMPLTDSLSKVYGAEIKRVSLKARNPKDIPNATERELLEAYAYQQQDSVPLQTNVQELEDNRYLFTKPIIIDNGLCLTCHGTVGNTLSQETSDFIKSKYPEDQATGYNIGDLRGMWSIVISKKNVILSMQD
jgi:hypothetical protein